VRGVFIRRLAYALIGCAVGTTAVLGAAPASPATPTVGVRIFHFVDRSRRIQLPDGRRIPRFLPTVVRYPTTAGADPLIVFAHGYVLTPATYAQLLRTWTDAGYVVAAPAFPREKAGAPGGPDEADLVNEPRDVSFVIDRLLALNGDRKSVLAGRIKPAQIAIAGHSDGAVAALAVADDRRYRDPRVSAAIVMSGAEPSGMGAFPRHGPPLLAVQGTADPINAPATTASFFRLANRPKFLLWLLGASHLPPYTSQQPQLAIVERATVAFLDHYLKDRPLDAFEAAARRPGLTRLTAEP
jgi:alpha-beta hydrolase superfamily lysophospholipase